MTYTCARTYTVNYYIAFSVGDSQHFDREVKRCLIESFKKTDEEFLSLAAKATPSWKDGSTVVVLLIIDNTIFSG